MKNLTLIVHHNAQQDVADRLRGLRQVQGFTFSPAEGHGTQADDPFLSARDQVVGYVPRVRVDILLEDAAVDGVLAALRGAETGPAGQGVYWVTEVAESGRL